MLKTFSKTILITAFTLLSFNNVSAKEVNSTKFNQITAEIEEGRAVVGVRLIYHNGQIIGYVLIYSDGSSEYHTVNNK